MTFRARPVDRVRAPRDPNRRNFYLNVGFGLAVVLSILILIVVAVATWYNDHLAAAGTVNGAAITKDEYRERVEIELWRLEQKVARVEAARAAGRLNATQANAQLQALQNEMSAQSLAPSVLENLIDTRLQAGLAAEEGVSVTPAQVDERILEESTTKEQRHAWLIAVQPEIDDDADEPNAEQKAAAKEIADKALADLKAGQAFEDVAKAVSDDSTAANGGDVGWIDEDASEDEELMAAIFALEPNAFTDVIESGDGSFLIGRVTEITPENVDTAWLDKLTDAGLAIPAYRKVIESEAIRQALEDKVIADVSKEGPQREVSVLYIQAPSAEPGEKAVKTRHILYSPKDDPSAASTVPAEDPSWTEAELAAKKAYDKLVADPSLFDETAREESDEDSAQGETGSGGKLPYFDTSTSIDEAFAAAIFADGLTPGQILAPFKSSFGWHVVQIMYFPPDSDRMAALRQQAIDGAEWADLVRDNSEGETAATVGEIGFIAEGQIDNRLLRAIYAAPVGGYSEVVEIPDDGLYLYKVEKEETRAPDEDQLKLIEASAFSNWYGEKKDAATITRDVLSAAGL